MKKFEIFFGIIKVPIDFLMGILGFWTALQLRLVTSPIEGIAKPLDSTLIPSEKAFLTFSIVASMLLIFVFAIKKLYSLKTTLNFSQEIKMVISSSIIWALLIMAGFFFAQTTAFSRLTAIYSITFIFTFLIIGRGLLKIIQNILLKNNIGQRNLIFIGTNDLTEKILNKLKKDPHYKIIGAIPVSKNSGKIKTLGTINELETIIKENNIDEIIQIESFPNNIENESIVETCDLNHVNYRFVPDLLQVRNTNIEVHTIEEIPVINLKPTPLDGWGKVIKRTLDIIGATFGIIITLPIMIITAIAIKIDSKGPILFSKLDDGTPVTRIGKYGKKFRYFKFRSMLPNTNALRYTELAKQNTRTEGPLVKIKNDPRVTRVGRFIRKYSIDELPELFQVLIGNMSLVGPRPHLPEEVAQYLKHHRFVLTIHPGITGLPQINGRSDLTFDQEVKLDRYYIENWTIWLDIKILLRTIMIVVKGHQE